MDEALLDRVQKVREYCRTVATSDTSIATGLDAYVVIRKHMALEILAILGENVKEFEVKKPLNFTSGNMKGTNE